MPTQVKDIPKQYIRDVLSDIASHEGIPAGHRALFPNQGQDAFLIGRHHGDLDPNDICRYRFSWLNGRIIGRSKSIIPEPYLDVAQELLSKAYHHALRVSKKHLPSGVKERW